MGCTRLRVCVVAIVWAGSAPVFGSGNFAWVGAFTGDFNLTSEIVTDNANNVYVCGFISNIFSSEVDADPGASMARSTSRATPATRHRQRRHD
jgi:hypothetical protein